MRRTYRAPKRRALAAVIAAAKTACIGTLFCTTVQAADDQSPPSLSAADTKASGVQRLDTIQVTGQRLDASRNQLSPETGSTIYRFDKKDIESLPFGNATPLNQLILQAPGVVQDSYGQLHVRGDHGNLQYRINNVVIPEAISGFGQSLDTRFADQIN
ncbi:MAG: TonB-dependent receptor, partial [Burkholderiaceae bacterium]